MKDIKDKPDWYTKEEIYHWLRQQNYSHEIGIELSEKWANDLQGSFNKGYEKCEREKYIPALKELERLKDENEKLKEIAD